MYTTQAGRPKVYLRFLKFSKIITSTRHTTSPSSRGPFPFKMGWDEVARRTMHLKVTKSRVNSSDQMKSNDVKRETNDYKQSAMFNYKIQWFLIRHSVSSGPWMANWPTSSPGARAFPVENKMGPSHFPREKTWERACQSARAKSTVHLWVYSYFEKGVSGISALD